MSIRRLFVDIETSPCEGIFWRPGYKLTITHDQITKHAAIICICYKWEGDKTVSSMLWDKKHNDKSMLRSFIKILGKADEVVAQNGDRFDLPWIRTRCLFHRIKINSQLPSVDTLKMAKKGMLFPSNRLDAMGRYMGYGGKRSTGGLDLWKDVMADKPKAVAHMIRYCKHDVDLLQKVHGTLYSYSTPKQHAGVAAGGYKHHCPECASDQTVRNGNKFVTAAGTVQVQMRCKDCGRQWRMSENTARAEQLREYKAKQMALGLA